MKNIKCVMLVLVFAVIIGLNTSASAQKSERQMSTAERRELQEERQREAAERRMSTAERRDLEQERRERTERIHREVREMQEQRERERQQRREQAQGERQMSTAERRDLQEERQQREYESRLSTAERRDLQQERQDRTNQIRRDIQQAQQQREFQRQQRLEQQFRDRGYNSYGNVSRPNTTGDTRAESYHGTPLNVAERNLYRGNWRLAYKVSSVRETATQAAENRFPGMNQRNTPADAFRHAYAAALLARDTGPNNAKYVTDIHETTTGNPPNERMMDLHNNAVGIRIGMSLVRDRYGFRQPTDRELADITEQALRQGALRFIQNR